LSATRLFIAGQTLRDSLCQFLNLHFFLSELVFELSLFVLNAGDGSDEVVAFTLQFGLLFLRFLFLFA
jgi:hypothetical protein